MSGKVDYSLEKKCYPFSVGTRNCVGQNVGKMDSRLVLGNIIWRYKFSQGEKFTKEIFEYKSGSIKRPKQEPKIRLQIR